VSPHGVAIALDGRMQPRTPARKTSRIIHYDFLTPGYNPHE